MITKYKLSEVCSLRTGKLNSNAAVENGEYPFFTCAQETFSINEYAFDTEAVLLGGNNANGVFPLKYYNGKFNAYQRTYVLESLNQRDLVTRYLYYALHLSLKHFQNASIGAATQYLTKSILDNFQIPLPSAEEQFAIVRILSAYDDLIENNRRRIELLEQAARLLYKEWFVHFRFPGHKHVKMVDGLPDGWKNGSAVDAMDILSGGTPKTTQADYWGGEIPFFTPKDSMDCLYVMATEKTITSKGLQSCNSKLYPKDTVFITARGTVGKVNLAQVPMAMNQSCYALVARTPVNQYYLYFALVEGVHNFKSQASGAVFDAIVKDTFKRIPFVIPNSALIEQFTFLVEPVIKQVENLTIQNQKLKVARDLLLPRLMNGEIAI